MPWKQGRMNIKLRNTSHVLESKVLREVQSSGMSARNLVAAMQHE